MEITVTIKNVYGEDKMYPACEKATIFCELLKQKVLTRKDLDRIKKLGYEIIILSPTIIL